MPAQKLLIVSLASTFRTIVQIALMPIIGRVLGPRAYGQMALVFPFIFFATLLAESGLGVCIVRAEQVTKELEGTIFCFSASVSIFLISLLAALAYPLGKLLGDPLFPALLLGTSSILLLVALNIVPMALLWRRKQYNIIALGDVVSTLGSIGAIATGVFFGWGIWSLVAQQITIWTCRVLIAFIGSRSRPRFLFHWRIIRENISFGSNLTASSMLSFIARNIDNVLIGGLMGSETLGYYALAFQIVGLPVAIMSSSVYYHVLSGISEASRKGLPLSEHFLKALRSVALLTSPVMVGLAVTAPLSIPFILGDKWLPTVSLLYCLAPFGFAQAMSEPIAGVLIGMGRSELKLKLGLLSSSAAIASIVFGVFFSSTTVALGISLAEVLSWLFALHKALELCKDASINGVLRAVSVPLIAAFLMGCVVVSVQQTFFIDFPLGVRLVISGAIGIFAYGAILVGLFRDQISDDIVLIKTALGYKPIKGIHKTWWF
ncbi:MAG TPA: oligosaccharide flippase family protein [Methylocella sp.]|nr:oligosaccharide flippase family protein [Methylocella sp.]